MGRKPAEPRRAKGAQAGERVDAQAGERVDAQAGEQVDAQAGEQAHSQAGARAADRGDGDGDGELGRVGPLAVERLRKPDGRALILYRDERQGGRA
jgi:hypothetical protein